MTVLAVEPLLDGSITSLQTSTSTYLAAGMGAHNTIVVDDDVAWWFPKNKHLATAYFRESVDPRTASTNPAPRPL